MINFGSINIDHVYRVPHLVAAGETLASQSYEFGLGGKGANQSVALAQAGVSVWHIGSIAKQDKWAVQQLAKYGVHTDLIQLCDTESGHAIIQVDDNGENSIVLHAGCNHLFQIEQIESHLRQQADAKYLLIQNETNLILETIALATELGIKVVFNPAPMSDNIKLEHLRNLHTLIVNETEAAQLTGENNSDTALQVLKKQLPGSRLILTLGSRGAIFAHGAQQLQIDAHKMDVVDTTAAGDTFVGYLVAGYLQGHDAEQAMAFATAASALAVTRMGAQTSIPLLHDVVEFLDGMSMQSDKQSSEV